jgi:small subunit ribosomal protein S20
MRRISRRTARNRDARTELKTLAKRVEGLRGAADGSAAREAAIAYVSALDKAAKRGIIHQNKARRHKSALSVLIFLRD